jgi:hypothetical protein
MQGYYQIASFQIPREAVAKEEGDYAVVDYIIVSRRSRDRAGLRYQRRGIDDDAHVANFVETETIMRVEVCSFALPNVLRPHRCFLQREGFLNIFSYVQIRGSSECPSICNHGNLFIFRSFSSSFLDTI